MKPLTDRFQIPRIKLAFLIDSLAAPLVILMPVSTWVAMLLMQLNKSGISLDLADKPLILADPFLAYLRVIPYTFYSFAILFSVLMIVYLGLSFGLMKRHEEVAVKTGNLFGGKPPLKQSQQEATVQKGKIIDFVMPLGSLLLFIFLAILYTGDTQLLGGNNPLLKTIQQADIFLCLLLGSAIAFIINYLQMVIRKLIAWHNITTIFRGGWDLMYGSILTLFLAWTFSELMKNDLQTGQYLARLLIGSVPAFSLPIMFFITALITAIATGSSWGTIAIMIPLAVPMTVSFFKITTPADPQSIPILFQIIGAVFSGAVAGDHLSPIASTSIMSATSAGAYLEDHIYSQFPYAIPALLGTSVAYIITGSLLIYNDLLSWSIAFCSAILVSLISLLIMNKKS